MDKPKFPKKLLEPVENFLQSKLDLLTLRLKNIVEEDPFSDPDRALDNSAIDTEAEEQFGHDMAVALKEEIELEITQIKDALDRIKKGEYGFCKSCGKMINTDRLMVYPDATVCMDCKEKLEKKSS